MKRFVKILLVGLFVFTFVLPAWSASAKVTFVKGKVEVNRKGTWVTVKAGDMIAESETISTGYQSEARLNLNGSVLAIAALTRVKVETLKSNSSSDTVSVYVDTGATRSKVTHTNNKKVDYTTRTAVAVASVRGTVYGQTAAGDTWCEEGAVAVYSAKDFIAAVDSSRTGKGSATVNTPSEKISDSAPTDSFVLGAGQSSTFDADGLPAAPEADQRKNKRKIINSVVTAAQNAVIEDGAEISDERGAAGNGGLKFIIKIWDGVDNIIYPTNGVPTNNG